MTPLFTPAAHDPARARKFRQAAFVYLHVAILYEAAVYAMWRHGVLPSRLMGPIWLWLLLGAVLAGLVLVAFAFVIHVIAWWRALPPGILTG